MSSNENLTQADILRDIINEKIKENFPWNDLGKKRELHNEILTKYPKIFTKESLRPQFHKILKQCLVRAKKDPREFGISAKPPRITNFGDSDMKADIKVETASIEPTQAAATDKTNNLSASSSTTTEQSRPWTDGIDADSVSATFSALLITLKIAFPEIQGLTDDEKKSLGKLWLPAFKKYLSEMQAIVLVPLFATAAIFAPKIAEARKLAKQKKDAEKKKEREPEK